MFLDEVNTKVFKILDDNWYPKGLVNKTCGRDILKCGGGGGEKKDSY